MTRKIVFVILFIITAIAASASVPQPEYMPYCNSPQQIAPMQTIINGNVCTGSSIVWNGKDFAVAWLSYSPYYAYFTRLYADGTPAAPPVALFDADTSTNPAPPVLVWNGSGYAAAYLKYEEATTGQQSVFFCRLDANGSLIGSPVRVSFYGETPLVSANRVSMAFSGNGYCVAWTDARNGGYQIFATLLDASGNVTYHDTLLDSNPIWQSEPSVEWLPGPGVYLIAYADNRTTVKQEIYAARLSPANVVTSNGRIITSTGNSWSPTLERGPQGSAMTWVDNRNVGNPDIYFALLNNTGSKVTGDILISSSTEYEEYPVCVWTGVEWGVFWFRLIGSSYDIWYQRVSSSGTLIGENVQVTATGMITNPKAAFAGRGFLVTGMDYAAFGSFVQPWGCNYAELPGCPSNLLAYGVSGSTATIAWQPALDNYTDIAYYAVYRNNAEIAKTSNTYYTDTGLGLNTTYNYTVRAVNAAQYMNDPQTCSPSQPQSVYVKTSSSFTLMLDKSSDPDAHLYWNDGGMNSYNIYRGTSPQVMSLIGTTSSQSADDNNVLLDTNTYFYTVDDPGQ